MRLSPFVVLALIAVCCAACHPPAPPPETPALETAQQNARIAATALGMCLAATSAGDKLRGETGGQIVMSDLEVCGADMLAAARASWALHEAQKAALAANDAGAQ